MRIQVATVVVALVLLPAALVLADSPIISSPAPGVAVGPSTIVEGRAPGADMIVAFTVVRDQNTGFIINQVPGLRDDVTPDGSFKVKIAEPRVDLGPSENLRYEVHVQSFRGRDQLGESIVDLSEADYHTPPTCRPGSGEAPILNLAANTCVAPNLDVSGSAQPDALVTVWTDVYRSDTNELLASVPGLRHYTNSSGNFAVRIATPRISFGDNAPLRYEVHARTEVGGACTPEAIVALKYDSATCASNWPAQASPGQQSAVSAEQYVAPEEAPPSSDVMALPNTQSEMNGMSPQMIEPQAPPPYDNSGTNGGPELYQVPNAMPAPQ